MDFFISYTGADRAWAVWIAWHLEAMGYTTVLQDWDFRPGGNFVQDMQQALVQSKRTIAVLSSQYLAARFTQAEWMAAFAQDPTGQHGLLVPIRVDPCDPQGLLAQIIYVDLLGADEMTAKARLRDGVSQTRARPTYTPPFPGVALGAQGAPPPFPGRQRDRQDTSEPAWSDPCPSAHGLQTETTTATQEIELTIQGKFEEYTKEDQARLLQAIAHLLEIDGPIHITKKRPGSIKLTLALSPEQAEELLWAVKRGVLDDYGVIDATLTATTDALLVEPWEHRPDLHTAPAVFAGETWTNSLGMEFVWIPAGTFLMGSPDTDAEALPSEKPAHRVTISQPFYLGKYPVTQAQWGAVMGTHPSYFKGNPSHPVEGVSWDDVQSFFHRLSAREGGGNYRLPTEAQWEYACRAGTPTPRYYPEVQAIAWYDENSRGHTHPVGQKLPNAWGLYDMLGNVWEWCHDGRRDYTQHGVIDPVGSTEAGAGRALRGGSWSLPAQYVRAASRRAFQPGLAFAHFGFRAASSGPSR